jgi:hypothetical protein
MRSQGEDLRDLSAVPNQIRRKRVPLISTSVGNLILGTGCTTHLRIIDHHIEKIQILKEGRQLFLLVQGVGEEIIWLMCTGPAAPNN